MKTLTGALIAGLMTTTLAIADAVDDTLILNEETTLVTRTAAPAHMADEVDEIISGWHFRGTETRAMQTDDFDNPGMIFVEQAEDTWNTAEGSAGKSCADCHGASEEMAGVRPVYPKFNEAKGEVQTLEMAINDCREDRMGAEKWGYTKAPMVNMTALLASVSRGLPINVAIDGPAQSTWELPDLPAEEHQAERCPCALQRLRARHPRRDLLAGQPGVHRTRAVRRIARQRLARRRPFGPQLRLF